MPAWSTISDSVPSGEDGEGQLFSGMSWSTRIQGCILFSVLGFFSSIMGWVALSSGSFWKYSVLSTLGNVMSLFSTIFLMGPMRQCKLMFDPIRRSVTLAYLGAMVLTVLVAVSFRSATLCAMCGMLQYAALFWYSLSYVPYGREIVGNCFGSCSRMVLNM